ncbi:tetratricopeptide repeat-containing sensor histidine kinase [Runella slithyformis]|uniref:histidine kinase n=1 Tax=Runella slithyformis (strain ATCC 29530 / DSM 19594 / LMG 11500 / NCIMB 11436 / LSU 4) TaxID=761193 RepID=A0A7U4E5E7_RUNSL|nr:histidine kinase dimerization/phosphoacceptor domain -containing protein [Runella slithyformis]AEI48506.1 signal transduction histidine kinase [Runella slithyformis DSM 19594]
MNRILIWACISLPVSLLQAQNITVPDSLLRLPYDSLKVRRLSDLAQDFIYSGNFDKARAYLKAADKMNKTVRSVFCDADLVSRYGLFYLHQHDTPKAIEHYLRAYELFERHHFLRGAFLNLQRVGFAYFNEHEYDQAEKYYKKTHQFYLDHTEKLPKIFLAYIFESFAALEGKRNNHALALTFNEKAVQILKKENDEDAYHSGLYNYALKLAHLKRADEAEGYFQEITQYTKKKKDIYLEMYVQKGLAEVYLVKHQPDEAIRVAMHGITLSKSQSEQKEHQKDFHQFLSRAYEQKNDFEKALKYYQSAVALNDSVRDNDKKKAIAKIEAEFQTKQVREVAMINALNRRQMAETQQRFQIEQAEYLAKLSAAKEQQLASIKAQAEIEKARSITEISTKYASSQKEAQIRQLDRENHNKTRQMQWLAAIMGILLLLLGGMVVLYQKVQKQNLVLGAQRNQLTTQNHTISEQSHKLELMMKELHHRVKNNLQIVSSLLNLQTYNLEDPKAVQAIREGQQRIEAMSLIHQRLYHKEHLTTIDMKEYLGNLIESIMRSYGYSPEHFELRLDIRQRELDVELAMPIGLIVNELVTNSFKYAYHLTNQPSLAVSLKNDTGIVLDVRDNGPGIDLVNWQNRKGTFGKKLIKSLSEQLGGEAQIQNEHGTWYHLHIPETRLKPTG